MSEVPLYGPEDARFSRTEDLAAWLDAGGERWVVVGVP
jgi:hypothetical protein